MKTDKPQDFRFRMFRLRSIINNQGLPPVQGTIMNYMPSKQSKLSLWDTWVYVTEDGAIHLFYLATLPNDPRGYAGHAVSRDWLHWEELPPIRVGGDEGEWDAGPVGTGMVFRYDDGRYYMSYTGDFDGDQQAQNLLVSDDLLHWVKLEGTGVWPCPQ